MNQDTQDSADSNSPVETAAGSRNVVKERALAELLPLIDELGGSPERRFELLMTAVRASDDETLLSKALDAAIEIEEPNAKADALLDIINEASLDEEIQV